MKKIGIFGGTFNPVHNGHLFLMEKAKELLCLDELWLMPAYTPPHKQSKDLALAEDRLQMLSLVCEEKEGFSVCRYEVDKGGKSYTFETAQHLKEAFPNYRFFFIMGADMLFSFDRWVRYRDILACFDLAAAARNEGEYQSLLEKAELFPGKVTVMNIEPFPLSSTTVRELVREGKSLSGLVPPKVERYIIERGLYR